MSDTEVKRHLRAAHRADPEAFDALLRDYQERGPEALDGPKPGANAGRRRVIQDISLALLLADVRNRAETLGSVNKALQEIADAGVKWADRETPRKIQNVNTAKHHYNKARKLEEESEEFAADVKFYRWALLEIGG